MFDFYFDQFALNYLAQLIMALAIAGYLLSLRNKSQVTCLLTLVFISIVLYAADSMLAAGSVWRLKFYATHLQVVFGMLIVVVLLQFAYRFPGRLQALLTKREPQAALSLSILAVIASAGWAIYRLSAFRPGGHPTTNTSGTNILVLIGFLWTVSIFLRHTYELSKAQNPARAWWKHFLNPQGREAQAAFAFTLVASMGTAIILMVSISAIYTSRVQIASEFGPSAVVLVALFLLSVFYFNYAPERISFMARLVSISLVTVLLLLGMVGIIIVPAFNTLFHSRQPEAFSQTLHFELQGDGSYMATSLPLRFVEEIGPEQVEGSYALSFPFPFYGRVWQEVNVRDVGILVPDAWSANAYYYNLMPAITAMRFSRERFPVLFVNSTAERFVVTWGQGPRVDSYVQSVLYSNGSIDLNFKAANVQWARRIGIQSGLGGNAFIPFMPDAVFDGTAVKEDGLLTDFNIQRQQLLHQNIWPLALVEIFAALFLIFVFPYFFTIVLVRPLNRLVEGVRAVDEGDLEIQVPVRVQDEIGLITESFNRMVASVHVAEQNLETLVQTRTAQLEASETRYRKLFETMTSGVLVFKLWEDGRFYLRDFNPAGERFGSFKREGVIGKPLEVLFSDSEAELLNTLLSQVEQSEPYKRFPSMLLNIDGQSWHEVTAYKLQQNEILLVLDNVTDRLANEARQQRLAVLEERERIGRELHDDLGQVLGFVNVQSQATLALLNEGETKQARAALRQLADVTQDAHDDVREYILGIRSQKVEQSRSFFGVLERYLAVLEKHYGLRVRVSSPRSWREDGGAVQGVLFTPEVETQLLRIIQEGLTNIRKHATEKEATLFFSEYDGRVQIVISDQGPGFDPAEVQTNGEKRFGLDIMRERAEKVGGTVEVRSELGVGTQIIVQIPLSDPSEVASLVGVRVLLVDDHQLYREGLRNLLMTKGMIVVGTAGTGFEAQNAARELRPDLILMDVEMPEQGGLDAVRVIKREMPELLVVMLTVAADNETLFQAMKFGASGYLLKSLEGDSFFQLLGKVLAGEVVVSPSMAALILDEVLTDKVEGTADAPEKAILTGRQIDVLKLIVQDKTNQEIGETLHISENTVKYHVRQILSQLQLRSRYELASYAEQRGLLDD